jgi:IS1 family transposase
LLCEILVVCGFLIAGRCNDEGWRNWLNLPLGILLVLCGLAILFLMLGWLWNARPKNPSDDERPHAANTVPQKYLLTSPNYWGTVIVIRRGQMANILPREKQIAVIGALAEGSAIRQIERMTGIHRDTIMRLGVRVGEGCAALLDRKMRNLSCRHLEFDELWGFIGKKQRHVQPEDSPEYGDVWTFCAIDADTKLVPSFKVGKRDSATANAFVADVASRLKNRVQISSDALRAYVEAVEQAFGANVDFAQIVKTFTQDQSQNPERKYSAPEFVISEKIRVAGRPNMALASTSYVERLNGTTRLHMRRLSRLTYAFSKKLENFEAAVALHFAYYNFVKRHNSLRCTPAMAAGIERDFWTVGDLVEAVA